MFSLPLLAGALCMGCTDRLPTAQQDRPAPATAFGRTIAVLECTGSTSSRQVSCREPGPGPRGGVSRAILGQNQVKLTSSNVNYDTLTFIFGFDVTLKNLLTEPIGTPDGITVTGNKVFYDTGPQATSYVAPYDTGTVTVNNPDGFGDFARPNAHQPYHLYNQIVQPQAVTPTKRWEIKVPRSVNTFGFTVKVYTALPSETSGLSSRPPSGMPAWLFSPDSTAACTGIQLGRCSRRVVRVLFQPTATPSDRQSAVAAVSGRVVGGAPELGYYYVSVGGSGTLASLQAALATLRALPQVKRASAFDVTPPGLDGRSPNDGTGWQRPWRVRPDQADGDNWAREQIGAPLAWGCETGDTAISVAVVDRGFHAVTDLTANLDAANSYGYNAYAGQPAVDHGTWTATALAGRGNNGTQITGTMWNTRLRVFDLTVQTVTDSVGNVTTQLTGGSLPTLWQTIVRAGRSGARVINVSIGMRWDSLMHTPGYNPATEANPVQDSLNRATRHEWYADFVLAMDSLAAGGHRPLIVFSAGNEGIPAEWNAARMVVDSSAAYRDQVIVVGASNVNRALWSGSNTGAVVSVTAPGELVEVLRGDGTIAQVNGTSLSAPHVAGIAGLLASFDRRLTAAQLKDFIVVGARRGQLTAGGIPIANAYWSLRRASERNGAPLCGNPVYQDSTGQVIVRRDSLWYTGLDNDPTHSEVLFTAAADTLPTVLHGGKRIRFASGNGWRWSYNAGTPTWTSAGTLQDTVANATQRSKVGLSHGDLAAGYVDTTVTVTKTALSSTTTTRTERFQVLLNGASLRTVDVTVPRRQFLTPQYGNCVSWYVSDPTVSNCLEYMPSSPWRDSTVTRAVVAFSPAGDTVVLAVGRDSLAMDVSAPLGNGATWERPYGLYEETKWTDLWFIPVQGGTIRTARLIERVEVLGISEDGRHLAAQTRSKFFNRMATANVNFETQPRYNLCTASYFLSNATHVYSSPVVRWTPYASTRSCFPGTSFAP